MDVAAAIEFVRSNHHAVLATFRRDGTTQMSPVACGVDAQGLVVISTRETAMKVHNIKRDPRAALCVLNDGFFGDWVQVDGTATILSLPDAMEPLVEYYRSVAGEHSDWDEYRAAMERDRRCVIRIAVERAGPNISG